MDRIKPGTAGATGTRKGKCQPSKFKICTQNFMTYEVFSRKQKLQQL